MCRIGLDELQDSLGGHIACQAGGTGALSREWCFLTRAVAWLPARDMTVRRVLSGNGSGYVAGAFRAICQQLGLHHLRTRHIRRVSDRWGSNQPVYWRFIRSIARSSRVTTLGGSGAYPSSVAYFCPSPNAQRRKPAIARPCALSGGSS